MTASKSWGRGAGHRRHRLRLSGISAALKISPSARSPPSRSQQALGSPGPSSGNGSTPASPPLLHPAPSRRHRKQARPKQWPGTSLSGPAGSPSRAPQNKATTGPNDSERRTPGVTFAAQRSGRNTPSTLSQPRPSPTYHRHRPPWRLGRPAGSPGRSRRSGLDPRWPAGSGEPAQTPQEPPPPPQRQSSALKRLSLRLPTAPPVGTAPRFDTVQSTVGLLVCSAPDTEGSLPRANRCKRSRRSSVRPEVDDL